MRNDEVIIITQYTENATVKREQTPVFAEQKSVTRAEFYSAVASGLTPKYIYEMDADDYQSAVKIIDQQDGSRREYQPSHIIADGVEYIVVRAYTSGQSTEVTVR